MSDAPQQTRRYYVVSDKASNAKCLVEAGTKSSALKRAAEFYCNVEPASAKDVIDIMREGGDVIEYRPGEDQELPLEQAQLIPQGDQAPPQPEDPYLSGTLGQQEPIGVREFSEKDL